ncbi:hypothetical protein LCM20_08155 [Halobacillus litoralis]|uniref:hypothetical protein n=1 Tax=Halobacillus litoralis TaxID=45668 RepID=UPI001CD30FB4|nr:hypothetical protein [Halobacillus litoralis]MCA0970555.1 hypothetical protein [Halobacillus litoralis]
MDALALVFVEGLVLMDALGAILVRLQQFNQVCCMASSTSVIKSSLILSKSISIIESDSPGEGHSFFMEIDRVRIYARSWEPIQDLADS